MSNNLDNDLRTTAAAFDVPPGDIDAVMTRAGRRTRTRRALTTVSTIAVVVAVVAVVVSNGRDHRVVPVHVAGQPARLGDAGVGWRRVTNASVLAYTPVAAGAGPVYALSTAPGQTDPNTPANRVVWRSDDGTEWQAVSTLGNDLFLADLAPTSDRIYAVGTGPATTATPGQKSSKLVAGWSDDNGTSWHQTDLPVDMSAIAARSLSSGIGLAHVASGPKGTLAVVTPSAQLDVNKVLPAGTTAPNGWAVTDNGVDVLGPTPTKDPCPSGTTSAKGGEVSSTAGPGPVYPTYCMPGDGSKPVPERVAGQEPIEVSPQQARGVTASYTWDQLGVNGDLLRAVKHQPIGFFAPVASTRFERIDLPNPPGAGDATAVQAGKDGFDVVLNAAYSLVASKQQSQPPSQVTIVHSADGHTWTSDGTVEHGVSWVSSAGLLAGMPALVADGDGGPVLLRSDGTGTWSPTSLAGLVDAPAGSRLSVASSGVGPFGVVAVVAAMPDSSKTGGPARDGDPDYRVLTSRDGITWQSDKLDDIAGTTIMGSGYVLVTGNQALITAMPKYDPLKTKSPPPPITMVGSAR